MVEVMGGIQMEKKCAGFPKEVFANPVCKF